MKNTGDEPVVAATRLILYGTTACHLCEIAQQLLEQHNTEVASIIYAVSDISESDDLFARYGVRIPVLRRADGAELDWPFSPSQLAAFVPSE